MLIRTITLTTLFFLDIASLSARDDASSSDTTKAALSEPIITQ